MKHLLINLILVLLFSTKVFPQNYKSISSQTEFFSSAPLEDIQAENLQGTGLFNGETGAIAFRIPIMGFSFRKALMQQHFNEQYMESKIYQNATFEGKLINYDLTSKVRQSVTAEGQLTIHGVAQSVKIPGLLTSVQEGLMLESTFHIQLKDYDIDIPRVVFLNIAEVVEVKVLFLFEEM